MTIISLIAAIDEKRGLGKENKLLCHLPADLKHFKDLTLGKPVIMGRNTYLSIGKALPGRLNIVLSRGIDTLADATVVGSLREAITLTSESPEVMIIGGGQVFTEALSYANRVYLTIIHASFDSDTFFPELDEHMWHCLESTDRPLDEKNKYNLTFYQYERFV